MSASPPAPFDALLRRDRNALDAIRLVAAALVLVSHAWPLTGSGPDPLYRFSGGQTSLGGLGVAVFFVISGFLVSGSWERFGAWRPYLVSRCLRIFPGLIGVAAVTALLLGPIVTTLPLAGYLGDVRSWAHLAALGFTPLPGVFEANPYPVVVNGSLWTLPYEFVCYLLLMLVGTTVGWRPRRVLAGYLVFLALELVVYELPLAAPARLAPVLADVSVRYGLLFGLYFLAGAAAYHHRDRLPGSRGLAVAALASGVAALALGGFGVWSATLGAWAVLALAIAPNGSPPGPWQRGDYSYGLYIYAFPVQQAVTRFWGEGIAPWQNMLLAFPVAFGLAALSWHLIERPALALKRRGGRDREGVQSPEAATPKR